MRLEDLVNWKKPYLWLIVGGTVFGWVLHSAVMGAPVMRTGVVYPSAEWAETVETPHW